MKPRLFIITLLIFSFIGFSRAEAGPTEKDGGALRAGIPILLYHRFGPVVRDGMTVRTGVFESHLEHLGDHGYTVIPLRHLTEYYLGKRQTLPRRSVVITVDDGHKSVYTDLFPLLRKYQFPVTLFLYPSALSNASYAMTWDQLREMKAEGLVDLQAHTYWHPNFKTEKKRLRPVEYENFVRMQFKKAKEKLEQELETRVDMLAWPFGIYDDELIRKALEAGYLAALTMERHHANGSDHLMALPRYLILDRDRGKAFGRILTGSPCS